MQRREVVNIHLDRPLLAASSSVPADWASSLCPRRHTTAGTPSCLAPGGVYRAAPVTWRAGALLPHRFTLTSSRRREAVCFLWHYPAGHPGLLL